MFPTTLLKDTILGFSIDFNNILTSYYYYYYYIIIIIIVVVVVVVVNANSEFNQVSEVEFL